MKYADAFPGRQIDRTEVLRAAAVLFDPDDPHELRSLPSGRSRLVFLADPVGLANRVQELSDDRGVYWTLNPVRRDLGDKAARVGDVLRRRWLLIDVDRVKGEDNKDESASQEDKDKCWTTAVMVRTDLHKRGWSDPLTIDSGNGYHLLYRIDLPNDKPSQKLLKAILDRLKAGHDTAEAEIDGKVHNASRISKLPGTWARKGPDTKDRPHRLARLIDVPERVEVVTREQLEALAGLPVETAHEESDSPSLKTADEPQIGNRVAKKQHGKSSDRDSYLRKALESEAGKVAIAAPGERNNQLNASAKALGELIGAGLSEQEVRSALRTAAERAGLDAQEIEWTIQSGVEAGKAEPRDVPERPKGSYERGIDRLRAGRIEAVDPDAPWEEPILDSFPPAERFPLDVLPESLCDLAMAVAHKVGCPADFPAMSMLAIASGAIGRSVEVAIGSDYIQSASLFVAIVGGPGSAKTPAMLKVARPLWGISDELLVRWKEEKARLRQQAADDPIPPIPRIVTDDTTAEALVPLLSENPRGLIQLRDELSAFFSGHNQYKAGGKGSDREFYLKLWSGAPVAIDRKSNEDRIPIVVSNPFLSILGAITPTKLHEIHGKRGTEDGMLERFLAVMPDRVNVEWVDEPIDPDVAENWVNCIRYLYDRSMVLNIDGSSRPFIAHTSDDAYKLWKRWFRNHRDEIEGSDFRPDLEGAWSKLTVYCARLALVLECLRWADDPIDDSTGPTVVGFRSVQSAIELIDYLKNHARRVRLMIAGAREDNQDARAVIRWLLNTDRQEFSERDVRQNFRGRFGGDDRALVRTIQWLINTHCVRQLPIEDRKPGERGRVHSPRFQRNPLLSQNPSQKSQKSQKPDFAGFLRAGEGNFEKSEGAEADDAAPPEISKIPPRDLENGRDSAF